MYKNIRTYNIWATCVLQSFIWETQSRFPVKKKKIFLRKISQAWVWPIVISFLLNEVTPFLVSVICFGRTSTTPKVQRGSPGLVKPIPVPQSFDHGFGPRHVILNQSLWDIKTFPGLRSLQVLLKERDYFLMGTNKEGWGETCWQSSCDPGASLPKNQSNKKPEVRNGDFLSILDHTSSETIPTLFK